jgi:putative alpha-1,2-mannosidase
VNGKAQQRAWFHHSDVAQGGKLVFTMGPEPNPEFGADVSVIPPSLTLS